MLGENAILKNYLVILVLLFCSACTASSGDLLEITEREIGKRTSISIAEKDCKVSIEFDEKSEHQRKRETLFIRNECLEDDNKFLTYINQLLEVIKNRGSVLRNIRGVFVGHLSKGQSLHLAVYAQQASEWKSFIEKGNLRGINKLTVKLLQESEAMTGLKSVFGRHDVTLIEKEIEKVSIDSLQSLIEKSLISDAAANYDVNSKPKVPYQGMLWFSGSYSGANDESHSK